MQLNNLLASPGFAAWMEGEPLDVGAPALHARRASRGSRSSRSPTSSDAERMFFVSLLLNQTLGWMRGAAGHDEPARPRSTWTRSSATSRRSANPPSKRPLLTLLKQARAFGLGVVLATQNPVDLDYKGLSQRRHLVPRPAADRARQGARARRPGRGRGAAASFDRAQMEQTPLRARQPRLPDAQRARGRSRSSSRPAGRSPTCAGR